MVLSGLLLKVPYTLVWRMLRAFNRLPGVAFYCPELQDYYVMRPVMERFTIVCVITKDKHVKDLLSGSQRYRILRLPAFPSAVVMCRHATHKFPCGDIVRIGMRHGAYHFKRLTKAENYNRFDLYLFTSPADLKAAEDIGVRVGKSVGYPRLDELFDSGQKKGSDVGQIIRHKLAAEKPTILFTATWNKSGMSAIALWYDKLAALETEYNVLVTLHPWIEVKYRRRLAACRTIHNVEPHEYLEAISAADVVVGDSSSALADCCALGKPIIRFTLPQASRSLNEIDRLLETISLSVDSFTGLTEAIQQLLADPSKFQAAQERANAIMLGELDGKAGERAWSEITALFRKRGIWFS